MTEPKKHEAYITVVGRGHNIFKLLGSENINPNKVTLSMAVLTSLGSRNFNNLSQKNTFARINKRQ